MRNILILFILCSFLSAQTVWVRVYYDSDFERETLLDSDYDLLTGNAPEKYFEYFLDEKDVEELREKGFCLKILHPDIARYLEETYGHLRMNFGCHYTYSEMEQELDQIVAAHPTITRKVNLGLTWQNREVWGLKISDNPAQHEGEPSVLITGAHHAREPIGCGISMDFINWLVDNYGVNDTATTIIDHDEVWIVPVVNPDGYVFNETYNDPWGNGWRKNCRDNNNNGQMDTDYDGVDLNRNYGYRWGYNNQGSSPNPPDEDYRGPSAFSEPETQAIRTLCDTFAFQYAMNYHSYADVLIVPWGYINDWVPAPDSAVYYAMCDTMTTRIGVPNNYPFGTAGQTIGYNANGTSEDWLYGEQIEKPKCFSFTTEVGGSFWEGAGDTNLIVQNINRTRPMNIYLCYKAAVVGIEEEEEPVFVSATQIMPNPVRERFIVSFTLPGPAAITVCMHDASGRRIAGEEIQRLSAGRHEIEVDANDLPAGVYFVSLRCDYDEVYRQKVVLLTD